MELSKKDLTDLKYAKSLLSEPSLAAKTMDLLGTPFEKGMQYLPEKWHGQIQQVTEKALSVTLNFALRTMGKERPKQSYNTLHKVFAAASGSVGGALGLSALAVELPVSTTIMFRSIADIARSEGEDIHDIETKLACLEVFALGGQTEKDDGTETGYFAIRAMLSRSISEAGRYIAEYGLAREGGPVLVRLISQIASRFGVVVTEKAAATAIPLVGAAGGAMINTIFMDHFQDMARGHFIIRRLERDYGQERVRQAYEALA